MQKKDYQNSGSLKICITEQAFINVSNLQYVFCNL